MTPSRGTLVRRGEMWLVGLDEERVLVADRKGLGDLRALLGRPGVEVHALDLVDAAVIESDLGEMLDATARRAIEQRIRDLQEDLGEAAAANDIGRAEALEYELDRLVDGLTAQLGLRGSGRRTGGTAERARNAVSWRIRSTINALGDVAPALARHLKHSVQLGIYASYRPEHAVTWDFGEGHASPTDVATDREPLSADGDRPAAAERRRPGTTRPPMPDLPGVFRAYEFVGRTDELARLTAGWIHRPRVMLVSGEAGAGKTRLIGEFVGGLEPRPTILWGRCTEARLGAYEPFVEPVRTLVQHEHRTGQAGEELARLVPELAADQGWSLGPSRADPEVQQRLLFEAVARLLTGIGPTVLVLEDLHWADAASLALLTFLVGNAALDELVVIGSERSTDQTSANAGALSDMRRVAQLDRIAVGGLARHEVARLVKLIADGNAPAGLVTTVADATDGNPLFVEELTQHLLAVGQPDGDTAAASRVPVSLRATIGRRLEMLSADTLALLRSGAVLGRTFDPDIAGGLAELSAGRVLDACDEALLSGLITEPSAIELSFSHALIQSAVYEATSARRRLGLHRAAATLLAERLEGHHASDATVFDIARHWGLVAEADRSAAPTAARWAVLAGDAAAAAADIDEAIARYEQAVGLWGAGSRDQASTLIRIGLALSSLGRSAEADERFRAARGLAESLGETELFARAAIGLAASVRYGHHDLERIDVLERAIELLPADQTVLRTVAAAMLKRQLGFESSEESYRRRQFAAELVLHVVDDDDLGRELLLSLGAARDSIVVDDPVVLHRLSRQIVESGSSPRNLAVLANGWYGCAWATLELGDGPGWELAVAAFGALAEELRLPYESALAATMASTSAQIAGRYAESEEHSARAFAFAIGGGDPNATAVQLTGAVLRGLDLGQAEVMLPLVESMRDELAEVPTFISGWAMTAALAGDASTARRLLHDQAAIGFDRIRRDLEWLPVVGFFCHACSATDDTELAPVLHELLEATTARALRIGPLAGWWGPIDYHLGALSRVMGRLDDAERRQRAALEMCRRLGARPWQARVQSELARVLGLAKTGRRRNAAEVDRLLASSDEIATSLGAPGLLPAVHR